MATAGNNKSTTTQGGKTQHLGTMRTPLGEFEIGKTLGEGSYGKVKLITNTKTNDKLAVKIVKRYVAPNPEKGTKGRGGKVFEQRILREANLTRFLRHTHIVPLKDCRITKSHFYLFHEYIPGSQLTDKIGRGGLSVASTRHYFRQIISGIHYCHSNFVVHRDIKVENIMIDQEDNVKIIDFGLANFFDEKNALKTFCGSLQYSAPEIMKGNPYIGPEVDIWSIGVVLFAMLTGTLPFDDPRSPGAWECVMNGQIKWPSNMEKIPKNLITRLLEPKSKRRITMSELTKDPFVCNDGKEELKIESNLRTLPKLLDLSVIAEMASCMFQSEHTILIQLEEELKKGKDQSSDVVVNNSPLVSLYILIVTTRKQLLGIESNLAPSASKIEPQETPKPTGTATTKPSSSIDPKSPPNPPKLKPQSALHPSSSSEQRNPIPEVFKLKAEVKPIPPYIRKSIYKELTGGEVDSKNEGLAIKNIGNLARHQAKRLSMFEVYSTGKQDDSSLNSSDKDGSTSTTKPTTGENQSSKSPRNFTLRRHKSCKEVHPESIRDVGRRSESAVEPKLLPMVFNQRHYLEKIISSCDTSKYYKINNSQSTITPGNKLSTKQGGPNKDESGDTTGKSQGTTEESRDTTLPSPSKNSITPMGGTPCAQQIYRTLKRADSEGSEMSDDSLPPRPNDFITDGKVSLFNSPKAAAVKDNVKASIAKLNLIKENQATLDSELELIPGVPQVSITECLRSTVIQIAKVNISVVSDQLLDALTTANLNYTWLERAFDFLIPIPRSRLYPDATGLILARVEIVHVMRAKSSAILLKECQFDPRSPPTARTLLPLDTARVHTYIQSLL